MRNVMIKKTHRNIWLTALAFAIIALLVAAACGSSDNGPTLQPTSTPVPTQSAATATPASATTAGTGGEFTRLFSDPPTLDPALTSDTSSAFVVIEVFSGLVTIDADLNIVPDIATRWDLSNDERTFTFHLRNDVKFHDGKPVTAHDFKFSMERALDPRHRVHRRRSLPERHRRRLRQAQRHGQQRQRNTRPGRLYPRNNNRRPEALFLAKLTYSTAFVVDQENVESGPDWTSRPNGTGAFRLAEWEIGERIRLERNDLYYKEPAHLDAVNLLLSGGVGMTMYENNEIDFTGVGLADIDRVLDPTEEINRDLQITPPDYSVSYFGLNTQMAPFDDIKVRKALALAINKELIAEAVLSNLVVPAYGILPPGFPGHNQNLQGIRFDIEEAMRSLAESSYGRGDTAIAELLMQADTAVDDESRITALSEASRWPPQSCRP